jgi:ABC-type molybdenum transport system ATPase subunit/photorepair protein PhrA
VAHSIEQVRNIALTGHNGAGKTTLAEAIIFNTGQLPRLGRVDDGTTISDHDAEEIERKISLRSSLLTGEVNGFHYDVIDTPGLDFNTIRENQNENETKHLKLSRNRSHNDFDFHHSNGSFRSRPFHGFLQVGTV